MVVLPKSVRTRKPLPSDSTAAALDPLLTGVFPASVAALEKMSKVYYKANFTAVAFKWTNGQTLLSILISFYMYIILYNVLYMSFTLPPCVTCLCTTYT